MAVPVRLAAFAAALAAVFGAAFGAGRALADPAPQRPDAHVDVDHDIAEDGGR